MNKHFIPLQPHGIYHMFNRAVGSEKLFRNDDNYKYFLHKFQNHVSPIAELLAYSLLPNHFHLLIKIKSEEIIEEHFAKMKVNKTKESYLDFSDFIMERFSNWANSYAKAYNKMYERKGALFIDFMRRSKAIDDADISAFIFYIHKNAVHHHITKKIGDWKYDSYQTIISTKPTHLQRQFCINWFGSKQAFMKFHEQPIHLKEININI